MTTTMQTIQSFITNLKQQSFVSIVLTTIVANTLYGIWYSIPFVSYAVYGNLDIANPVNQSTFFMATMFSLLNMLIAVLGLALLISKKGALSGFVVGSIVAIFFSINAYLSGFSYAPDLMPSTTAVLMSALSFMIFYALPGTLLGYLRKQ